MTNITESDNFTVSESVIITTYDLGLNDELKRILNLLPHWWRKDGV